MVITVGMQFRVGFGGSRIACLQEARCEVWVGGKNLKKFHNTLPCYQKGTFAMVIILGQETMRSPRRLVSRKRRSYECIGDRVWVRTSVHRLSTAPRYTSYHHILLGYSVGKTVKLKVDRATVGLFMFLRCLSSGASRGRINTTCIFASKRLRLVSTCIVHVQSAGTHCFQLCDLLKVLWILRYVLYIGELAG